MSCHGKDPYVEKTKTLGRRRANGIKVRLEKAQARQEERILRRNQEAIEEERTLEVIVRVQTWGSMRGNNPGDGGAERGEEKRDRAYYNANKEKLRQQNLGSESIGQRTARLLKRGGYHGSGRGNFFEG